MCRHRWRPHVEKAIHFDFILLKGYLEGRMLCRNIVRCFGGAGSDRPFMLLEYVEGGSLRKLMLLQMSSPGRRFYTDASALR